MPRKNTRNTRGRIISAAWKLFYEQGYEDTTVEDIVFESETSKGSFYHYFDGKDALLGTLAYVFDEKYEQIFEESDFGWLLREAGYENFLSTAARTDHYGFLEPGCVPALRQLGIEKPYRTYCFARNRLRFARKHFSFPQVLSVALVFAPLSALYYGAVALKHRRPDIAWAYLKGTLAGLLAVTG